VIATLGIAIEIPPKHVVRVDGDALVLRRGRSVLTAYSIGSAWARELSGELLDRATATSALGPLTVGTAPEPEPATTPIAKLQRAVRDLLPQPAPGTQVILLARDYSRATPGALVVELGATTDPFVRDQWLEGLRAATTRELRAVEPVRIELEIAERTGPVRVLVTQCADPEAALFLDDPDRIVERGARFKCTSE
jgi:hypothetical protein